MKPKGTEALNELAVALVQAPQEAPALLVSARANVPLYGPLFGAVVARWDSAFTDQPDPEIAMLRLSQMSDEYAQAAAAVLSMALIDQRRREDADLFARIDRATAASVTGGRLTPIPEQPQHKVKDAPGRIYAFDWVRQCVVIEKGFPGLDPKHVRHAVASFKVTKSTTWQAAYNLLVREAPKDIYDDLVAELAIFPPSRRHVRGALDVLMCRHVWVSQGIQRPVVLDNRSRPLFYEKLCRAAGL